MGKNRGVARCDSLEQPSAYSTSSGSAKRRVDHCDDASSGSLGQPVPRLDHSGQIGVLEAERCPCAATRGVNSVRACHTWRLWRCFPGFEDQAGHQPRTYSQVIPNKGLRRAYQVRSVGPTGYFTSFVPQNRERGRWDDRQSRGGKANTGQRTPGAKRLTLEGRTRFHTQILCHRHFSRITS
jgi:hypothetical protein